MSCKVTNLQNGDNGWSLKESFSSKIDEIYINDVIKGGETDHMFEGNLIQTFSNINSEKMHSSKNLTSNEFFNAY